MYEFIAKINEKAIHFMNAEDYEAAAALLSHGMSVYEEEQYHLDMMTDDENDVMEREEGPHLLSSNFFVPVRGKCSSSLANRSCSSRRGEVSLNNNHINQCLNSFALHDRAANIPDDLSPVEFDCDCNLIQCILLYNHGLCLHLQANTDKGGAESIEELLEESLLSYEMALGLVTLSGDSPVVQGLELAILNNSGHIHSLQLETQHVHSIVERMQLLVQHLLATNQVSRGVVLPFILNIIYNSSQYDRPAPAA